MTREDFQLYDASYHDDWTRIWIQQQKYRKKYWFFGELIPDYMALLMFGNEPLEFDSVTEAEEYIQKLINE